MMLLKRYGIDRHLFTVKGDNVVLSCT